LPQGPVGTITAVKFTWPRTDGLQEQVAENEEPLPLATLFLHAVITTPFALKVTFAGVLIFKLIVVGDLKVAVVEFPVKLNELIVGVTTPYRITINPDPPVPPNLGVEP
jgi:hypothetical protein